MVANQLAACTILLLLTSGQPLHAATCTLMADGNWSDPTKWSCGAVPTATDDVVINGNQVTLNVAATIHNLTITGGSSNGGILGITSSTTLTVTGTFAWSGGVLTGNISGSVSVAQAATISGATTKNLNFITLLLNGGGTFTGGTINFAAASNLSIPSGQTFIANSASALIIGPNGSLTCAGTLQKLGSGDLNINLTSAPVTGALVIDNNSGITYWGCSSTHTGAFTIGTGSKLLFSTGTQTLSGATFTGAGTIEVSGGTVNANSGTTIQTGLLSSIYNATFNDNVGLTHTNLTLAYANSTPGIYAGGQPLALTGNLTISGGTLFTTGTVSIAGTLNWSDGKVGSPTSGAGTVTVAGLATFSGATSKYLYRRTMLLNGGGSFTDGNINNYDGGNLTIPLGQTLTANSAGTLNLGNAASLGGAAHTITIAGTLDKQGAGDLSFPNTSFSLTGAFQLNGGTAHLLSGGAQSGNFSLATGTTAFFQEGNWTLTGVANGPGKISLNGTATVTLNSGFSANLLQVDVVGTSGGLTVNTNTTFQALNLSATTMDGGGSLNVGDTFAWSGGTLNGTGPVTVAGATTISTNNHQIYYKTLLLNGGGAWSGGNISTGYGVILRVAAGQALAISAPGGTSINHTTGAADTFDNLGTVTFNSSGIVTIGIAFNNTGTTQITGGTLRLGNGGNQTGAFSIAANEQLEFTGGTHTLNAPTFTGGTTKITGGTVTLAGGVNLPVSTISDGTVNGTGTLTSPANLAVSGTSDLSFTGNLNVAGNLSFTGGSIQNTGNVNITGTLTWNDNNFRGTGTVTVTGATSITGSSHQLYNKTLLLNGGGTWSGGSINTSAGAILRIPAGQVLAITTTSSTTITNAAAPLSTFDNIGTVAFNNSGAFNLSIPFTNSGTVKGTGTVNLSSSTVTNNGHFAPGNSPGTLNITGNYTNSTLDIEIEAAPLAYDKLVVSGTATLGGTLNLTATGNVAGGTYPILTAASVVGTFATLNLPDCYSIAYTGTAVNLIIGVTKTWDGTNNNWSTAADWIPTGVPCPFDDVIINSGVCSLNIQPEMKTLTINGGELKKVGAATYTIDVPTIVAAPGFLNIFDGTLDMNNTLDNNGTIEGYGMIDIVSATMLGGYGTWRPGNSAGKLTCMGTHTNEVVAIEIGNSGGVTEWDKLDVTENMVVGGSLILGWLGGTVPPGNRVIMECFGGPNCRTGTFGNITYNLPAGSSGITVVYEPTIVRLVNTIPIEFSGPCSWLGGTGNWDTPSLWSCGEIPNGNDDVTFASGQVTLTGPTTVNSLNLSGGIISGSNSLIVNNNFLWSNGQISAAADHHVGPATISGMPTLTGGNLIFDVGGSFANAANLILGSNGQLTLPAGANLTINNSTATSISKTGTGQSLNILGSFVKQGAGTFTVNVPFIGQNITDVQAGILKLNNLFNNLGGTIKGNATLDLTTATVTAIGTLTPGASPGTLHILGDYVSQPTSSYVFEIMENGGTITKDLLDVSGTALLGGSLSVNFLGGNIPFGTYPILTSNGLPTGGFSSIEYVPGCPVGSCSIALTASGASLVLAPPLPVALLFFHGKLDGKAIRLDWATATEANFDSFDIERSGDAENWAAIASLAGHAPSTERHYYSITDRSPAVGTNFYRLKMKGRDGSAEFSEVAAVDFGLDFDWKIFPNPAGEELTIQFSEERGGALRLFDWSGRKVLEQEFSNKKTVVNLHGLPNGAYWLRVAEGEGRVFLKN